MVLLEFLVSAPRSLPMKTAIFSFSHTPFLSTTLLAAAFIISFSLSLPAQQPPSNSVDVQREAMRKLSFLAGHWSGPVTIVRGPDEALHLTQMEDVEYKLDDLVLLIEGKSTSADGKVLFNALATIAYDDASHTITSAPTMTATTSTRSFRCPLTAFRGALRPGQRTL
jgi:hypothetical protein